MSLQTLLDAAKYIELQEQLNSTSSSAATALTIRPPLLSASSTSSNSSSTSSTDAIYNHRNSFINSSSSNHHSHHHNNNSNASNNNNHSTNLNNNNINRTNNNSRNSYRNRQHHEQRRGNKRSSTGSSVVASNYPSSASSSPHSPVGSSSQSSNTLLTNGGGNGGINGISNHHAAGGLSGGSNGILSTTTNGITSNHILAAVQSSVVDGYDYDGRHQTSISVGNSEEPCRNGEHPKTSPPPPVSSSSYLLISANNENGIGGMVSTTISKCHDGTGKVEPCLLPCNSINVVNNASNNATKVDISNKCMPNDPMLQSQPNLSSTVFNATYPTSSTSRQLLTTTPSSRSPVLPYSPPPSKIKKFTPLTPPPTSSRKLVEITRTRSSSLSSTNFTANVVNGGTPVVGVGAVGTPINGALSAVVAAAASVSATDTSLHSAKTVTNSGGGSNGNVLANSGTEDSSQSSLNLSSSGYLSGSSVNSSVGVSSASSSNLNVSNNSSPSSVSSVTGATTVGLSNLNGSITSENQLLPGQTTIPTSGRRRTISTNSTGGKQRSPCILRAGTREVHNKLEKHRRAHLKECFEQLKKQLDLRDEERKKTSNLAILGAAYRCVMNLKRKERELEQQVEKLAKEKINYQKRIVSLKRELASKHDNIDFSSILPDTDIRIMPSERDSPSGSTTRYSSSSSLSSATTVPSPAGSGSGSLGIMLQRATSPQVVMPLSSSSLLHSPSNHHHNHQLNHHHIHHPQFAKSISPVAALGNSVPLSLTMKSTTRGSPTPSTPSPSSSSMNGIPPSSPIISSSGSPSSSSTSSLSASPPISISQSPLGTFAAATLSSASVPISLKIQNVPNGMKVHPPGSIISSSTTSSHQHIPPSSSPLLTSASNLAIISSSPHHSSGLSVVCTTPALSTATVLNYTTSEISSSSILAPAHLPSTTTINSLPLNLNAPANLTFLHSGKNGVCRKSNDLIVTTQQQPQQSLHSSLSVTSASITAKDKLSETSNDQTPKCINLVTNGIITQLDQTKPVSLPQGLVWAIGSVPSRNSRLLVSTTTPTNGGTSSESAILPGGAEVNVLPRSGNVTIMNNGIAFKGADGVGGNGHAVHVMTPIQPRLTPSLVVPQGLIPPQLSGNVLSVSGRQLPIINTQYLNGMEQMVVVANNPSGSTLSSVPTTTTSVALATATINGSIA